MDAVKNVVIDYVSRNTVEDVSVPNDPWTDAVGSDASWDEESPDGTNRWAEGVKLDNTVTVDDIMNAFIIVGAVDEERRDGMYQFWDFTYMSHLN